MLSELNFAVQKELRGAKPDIPTRGKIHFLPVFRSLIPPQFRSVQVAQTNRGFHEVKKTVLDPSLCITSFVSPLQSGSAAEAYISLRAQ
jgi:hypothetical protein